MIIDLGISEEIAELEEKLAYLKRKSMLIDSIISHSSIEQYIEDLCTILESLGAKLHEEPEFIYYGDDLVVSMQLDDGRYWIDIYPDKIVLRQLDGNTGDVDTIVTQDLYSNLVFKEGNIVSALCEHGECINAYGESFSINSIIRQLAQKIIDKELDLSNLLDVVRK